MVARPRATIHSVITWPRPPRRRTDRWRAKYELSHVVRTHMGQDDAHYGCVYQREDGDGNVGECGGGVGMGPCTQMLFAPLSA